MMMPDNSVGPKIKVTSKPVPPCATWNVWIGNEIEGVEDIGVRTLFIRRLPAVLGKTAAQLSFMTKQANRLWLCKEFLCWCSSTAGAWVSCRELLSLFEKRCLEVTPTTIAAIPNDVLKMCRVYVKVSIAEERLKPGDVICVGPAFYDESFTFGTGKKVAMVDYTKDIKIS